MSNKKNGLKKGNKKTQFSKTNQPSPKARSLGWERKRLAKEFMDRIFDKQEMTIAEFEAIEKAMKKKKSEYTMRDLMAKNYVKRLMDSDKFILDWLDRHVGKVKSVEDKQEEQNTLPHKVTANVINKHRVWNDDGSITEPQG